MIAACSSVDTPGWRELRAALYTDCTTHGEEMAAQLADPCWLQVIAYEEGKPLGLAEAALRADYVNGTDSSPVAFLEGLYVVPEARRRGVAASLVAAVTQWARQLGCRELASDARLENTASHALHRALGFEETERVVFFRKPL